MNGNKKDVRHLNKSRYSISNKNNLIFAKIVVMLDLNNKIGGEVLVQILNKHGIHANKNKVSKWKRTDQSNRRYTPISDELLNKILDALMQATKDGDIVVYHNDNIK